MENFLKKLQQQGNPTSQSNTPTPQAVALMKLIGNTGTKASMGNGDIRNPVGYIGTNGYNGDYGALLADQIKNSLGNTGLYEQIQGSNYDQMMANNRSADGIYDNRKDEVGGMASKELANQKAGYGSNWLNAVGDKQLSAIDNSVEVIRNDKKFVDAAAFSSAYTKALTPMKKIAEGVKNGTLTSKSLLDASMATPMIEAYGQAITGGILTNNLYDQNGQLNATLWNTVSSKLGSAVSLTGDKKATMTAKGADEMFKAIKSYRNDTTKNVRKLRDQSLGSGSAGDLGIRGSTNGTKGINDIQSVQTLNAQIATMI